MTHHRKTVMIAAGGTMGHVAPAAALIEECLRRNHTVYWLTDDRGARFATHVAVKPTILAAAGVAERPLLSQLWALMKLIKGCWQVLRMMRKLRPDMVMGVGGYASVPTCLAAIICGVPLFIHEQNAVLGRANRWLVKACRSLYLSFPLSQSTTKNRTVLVGNPVRSVFHQYVGQPLPPLDATAPLNVLIVGGSQGAAKLAELIPHAMQQLPFEMKQRLRVIHQCRPQSVADVQAAYVTAGIVAEVAHFYGDLPQRMAASHLVICRAGAGTIAELMVLGRASILVPFAKAIYDHQTLNAWQLAGRGGAEMLTEQELSAATLANRLQTLLSDPTRLKQMAARAADPIHLTAAVRMVDDIERLLA